MSNRAKEFDIFLSHASEDSNNIARPLANRLKELGLTVWFDEITLEIGDKLRDSIDRGLRSSDFGVVILSKNFFSKKWTKAGLEGLFVVNESKILPIWHNLSLNDVINFSPMLASIVAIPSSKGVEYIAHAINRVVTKARKFPDTKRLDSPLQSQASTQYPISEIQNSRFRFLLLLYQRRDRVRPKNNPQGVGNELGFSKELTTEITEYYSDKLYIEHIANCIEITPDGIDHLEQLIPTSSDVVEFSRNRNKFLYDLYQIRSSYWGVDRYELGNRLGFSDKTTEDVCHFLIIGTIF